jgi:hypothetical protein
MKTQMLVYLLLLSMPITGCAQGHEMKANSQAQSQVDALATKLANKEVGKVEIIQIPARILTRTRITPEMLERQFHYKLIIRDVRGGVHQQKLTEVVKSIAVQPGSRNAGLTLGRDFLCPR